MSLWQRAINISKAVLLDEINLGPDDLLKKVEEFENISQAAEHSYPALVLSSEDGANISMAEYEESKDYSDGDGDNYDIYHQEEEDEDDEFFDSDDELELDSLAPIGSLPIDQIVEKLKQKWKRVLQ